ncbi:Molybdenum cofactor biosynthesis protein MoaA [invertebrate metagenome]|uniref:Molybdenum cofactor biosynthesis protein MoaA n=1 Tax=invertebrate metagenome TaxID=1711999 RepID=A0A484H6S2_9ZZZZ
MAIPLIQKVRVGSYILKQRLKGVERYPLVLMLEPLFRCNLACTGCGKIAYPDEILNLRLSVEECLHSVEECGAPVVSIPGGEPLLHREIGLIVAGLVARKKFVYLCTNALLLEKRLDLFTPSPYLTFQVHLDGDRVHHDRAVAREGVYDRAVAAIRVALGRGFRVNINCTLYDTSNIEDTARFFTFVCRDLGVEGITLSPGFAYGDAPLQGQFLARQTSRTLFRRLFALKKSWRFSHSALFLDFLAGNQSYQCTPWGNPTRNVFGWQRPCYLLGHSHAATFQELMNATDWSAYGAGQNIACANCMMHCGFEPTAVIDTMRHPWKALRAALYGPRTRGTMAPELPPGTRGQL